MCSSWRRLGPTVHCSLPEHSGGSTKVMAGKRLPAQVCPYVDVTALLTSFAPLYKIACFPHQSQAGEGVPTAEAGAPHLGKPICQSLGLLRYLSAPHSSTHIPHTSAYAPLFSLLCHTISLPAVQSATISRILHLFTVESMIDVSSFLKCCMYQLCTCALLGLYKRVSHMQRLCSACT